MNATTIQTKPTLTQRIEDIASNLERHIDPCMAQRESWACLQSLEELTEYLHETIDEIGRLAEEVREVCVDQRDEARESRYYQPLTIDNQRVKVEYRTPERL